LRKSLAEFTGVDAEYLIAGAGADELLDLLMRVFLEPNECILSCPPTFGMYPFDAELNAARCIEVPRNADFSLNMDGIKKAVDEYKPKLFFIASPNNPDGSVLDPKDVMDELLEFRCWSCWMKPTLNLRARISAQVSAASAKCRTGESGCVAHIQQMGRVWQGLRIGYGAFPKWLMPTLWKSKQPYNVNVAASVAAQASLANVDELKVLVEKLKMNEPASSPR
jgi:histidinol-phosphate aminotransferase